MKVVYVSGPYRSYNKDRTLNLAGIKENIDLAWRWGRIIWEQGGVAICPHANTAFMDGDSIPVQAFLDGDLELLRRSDAILMVGNWRESEGARLEKAEAEKIGMPVFLASASHELYAWLAGVET